jgi:hypothetical protein
MNEITSFLGYLITLLSKMINREKMISFSRVFFADPQAFPGQADKRQLDNFDLRKMI